MMLSKELCVQNKFFSVVIMFLFMCVGCEKSTPVTDNFWRDFVNAAKDEMSNGDPLEFFSSDVDQSQVPVYSVSGSSRSYYILPKNQFDMHSTSCVSTEYNAEKKQLTVVDGRSRIVLNVVYAEGGWHFPVAQPLVRGPLPLGRTDSELEEELQSLVDKAGEVDRDGSGALSVANAICLGYGGEINDVLAGEWLKKSAEKGLVEGMELYADWCDQHNDKKACREWRIRAAEKGSLQSMYLLGVQGEEPWIAKAAKAGHGGAMVRMGENCRDQKNIDAMLYWLNLAARQGEGRAMSELMYYYKGDGRSPQQAWAWCVLARALDYGVGEEPLYFWIAMDDVQREEASKILYEIISTMNCPPPERDVDRVLQFQDECEQRRHLDVPPPNA